MEVKVRPRDPNQVDFRDVLSVSAGQVVKQKKQELCERQKIKDVHEIEMSEMISRHQNEIDKVLKTQKEQTDILAIEHHKEIETLKKMHIEERRILSEKQDADYEDFERRASEHKRNDFPFSESIIEQPEHMLECPVCFEEMLPPVRIFNCPNGHVICGSCKKSVSLCTHCRMEYCGRATAMEQLLRSIYGEN